MSQALGAPEQGSFCIQGSQGPLSGVRLGSDRWDNRVKMLEVQEVFASEKVTEAEKLGRQGNTGAITINLNWGYA